MTKKILMLFFIIFSISIYLQADELTKVQLKLNSETFIYKSKETTFILLTISNSSNKEIKYRGYEIIAESFTAINERGQKMTDSQWVAGLRCKSRVEPPIIILPQNNKTLIYTLTDLFIPEKTKTLEVSTYLDKQLKIDINDPKF